MNNTGINNKLAFLLGICILCMASCTSPYVTFTETYYISNEAEDTVRLLLEHPVVWDNNASENPQIVYYDSCCLTVSQGSTVRLHPVVRESKDCRSGSRINIAQIIGTSVKLVAGKDTIVWSVKNPYMFTSDRIWSIYNTADWQTTDNPQLPYAYDHTFTISTNRIEGSIQ